MPGTETTVVLPSWRRLPIGAEPAPIGGAHFRVWAPAARRVDVVLEDGPGAPVEAALESEPSGYFSGLVPGAAPGTLYRYRLDGRAAVCPDPASRFQPSGPHGSSRLIAPDAYVWGDAAWRGVRLRGQVMYEMHIGTFTPEGSWAAAMRELPELQRAGFTVLEIMPVAEFPGRFGWGYDGVALFAPTRLYGEPDDFRRFVDRAHALGLGVILDVVYNHLGPDGCSLKTFSSDYFTDRYQNEWGEAINFDGPAAGPVREFFASNAAYWIDEFHLDGLRLDATQTIHDGSPEHVITTIVRSARAAARGRDLVIVAENEPQDVGLVRAPQAGGYGVDGLWNDDFHHTARVALTGRNEAYYTDYLGTPQELISAVKWGYLYQGQRYRWQREGRGTPTFGLEPATFVAYLQNHDQVANSLRGERLHRLASPGGYRAVTALLCLGPATPLFFQGQEFCASSPFLFFADHAGDLGALVRKGRTEFLAQFPSIDAATATGATSDPLDPATFERCKLRLEERQAHAEAYALHADLLRLRREDPAFRAQRPRGVEGAVLGPEAFLLRFFGEASDDRLLLVNLGPDLRLEPAPEPLLAPPLGGEWALLWSSEDPRYGGSGMPAPLRDGVWCLPGHAALVMRPARPRSRPHA